MRSRSLGEVPVGDTVVARKAKHRVSMAGTLKTPTIGKTLSAPRKAPAGRGERMSMILGLTDVSERTRQRLLADPPLVWRLIAPDDPEAYADARARSPRPSLLRRLLGGKAGAAVSPPAELELEDGEGDSEDLDKAWHGIHFLLTGRDEGGDIPAGFLLAGGQQVGSDDVGYGPARVLSAADTRAVAAHLERCTDADLRARFDPERMMALDIYPGIWDRDPDEDDVCGYLLEYWATLRRVVGGAARRGHGLLITLT